MKQVIPLDRERKQLEVNHFGILTLRPAPPLLPERRKGQQIDILVKRDHS